VDSEKEDRDKKIYEKERGSPLWGEKGVAGPAKRGGLEQKKKWTPTSGDLGGGHLAGGTKRGRWPVTSGKRKLALPKGKQEGAKGQTQGLFVIWKEGKRGKGPILYLEEPEKINGGGELLP